MFNSLAAHQVLNKMDILLGLLLKPRMFEQFQSAPLGAPVVPCTKDPGRAPMVSHLAGQKINLIKDIPSAAVQKQA